MSFLKVKNYLIEGLFICFQRMPRGVKYWTSRMIYKPKLGKNVKIYGYGVFGPNVKVGDYSYFNDGVHISNISIGKYVRVAKGFQYISTCKEYEHFSNYKFFGLHNSPLMDRPKKEDLYYDWSSCSIGNDVWIGENVTIVGPVSVGDGAVIGANSVVTKDVKPYSIVAGNPARYIKMRFDEEKVNYIKNTKWWDMKPEEIYQNYEFLVSFQKIQ